MWIGPSGIIFTRSKRSLAGTAIVPPLFTSAGMRPAIARYRSVAARRSALGPSTAMRTFDRTGMVLLRSATPCIRVTSLRRSFFATVISMGLARSARDSYAGQWLYQARELQGRGAALSLGDLI